MAGHHVEAPEQVANPGEELWVKIIDVDLQRRRISLSIKQAAEGGEVSEEYREAFGEHAYDEQGNYIGYDYAGAGFTPETEAQAAWAEDMAAQASLAHAAQRDAGSEAPAAQAVPEAPAAQAVPEAPAAQAVPEAPAAQAVPEAPAPETPAAPSAEAAPEAGAEESAPVES
jgi:small subunit ribosomal protein S1